MNRAILSAVVALLLFSPLAPAGPIKDKDHDDDKQPKFSPPKDNDNKDKDKDNDEKHGNGFARGLLKDNDDKHHDNDGEGCKDPSDPPVTGSGTPPGVPEPATLALLAIAAAIVLARRLYFSRAPG